MWYDPEPFTLLGLDPASLASTSGAGSFCFGGDRYERSIGIFGIEASQHTRSYFFDEG
jgi:hypothetical protein